jgi:hypothetical protein
MRSEDIVPDRDLLVRTCTEGACCALGPGHEHILCPDGVERLLWADGAETDLLGYRSGSRDSPSAVHRWAREHLWPRLAREEFARVLDTANSAGSDALS